MGTLGYKVYRSKGRYFVWYNHYDSYPSYFGLEVLHLVPRNVSPEEFEEWVKVTEEWLERDYEELRHLGDHSYDVFIMEEQPVNDIMIEWVYEIDLDNRVFHVDASPLFRLDHLPPDDVFLSAISCDHFGHLACHSTTPEEYRYNWRAPPPTPEPRLLESYASHCNESSSRSVHEMLGVHQALSAVERARTRVMEVLVTVCLRQHGIGRMVRILENVSDRAQISDEVCKVARLLVNLAIRPPNNLLTLREFLGPWDFTWVRKDVCLYITTHLDDIMNLKATIGDMISRIKGTPEKTGVIYGVACSLFHCAIVCVDTNSGGTCMHTPVLQFLPSLYATTSATPGMEALCRLGCQSGLDLVADIAKLLHIPGQMLLSAPKRGNSLQLPVELCVEIGRYILSPKDLVSFAAMSSEAMLVAADLLRYPCIEGYRLVDSIGEASSSRYGGQGKDQEYKKLASATFKAFKGGCDVQLAFGCSAPYSYIHRSLKIDLQAVTGDSFFYTTLAAWELERSNDGKVEENSGLSVGS